MDAILEAAARVLETDGYQQANVNRVAALAGVSIGSLYQYFPTKEALAAGVAKQLSTRMLDTFGRDLLDLASLPPREAIVEVVGRAIQAFRVAPRLRRVLHDEVLAAGAALQTTDFDSTLRAAFVGYLELHRGAMRPQDLDMAVRVVMTAVEGIAETWAGDPALDADTLARETAELVTRYLLRD